MQLFWGHVFELGWFRLSLQPFKVFFESQMQALSNALYILRKIIDNFQRTHVRICLGCVCESWPFKIIPWPTQSHSPSRLTTCQAAAYLRKILIFGLTHDWGSAPKLTNWHTNIYTHTHTKAGRKQTQVKQRVMCVCVCVWPLNLQAALQAKLPGCTAENHIKIQQYKLVLAQVKMFDA